jgi:hypothetical protein
MALIAVWYDDTAAWSHQVHWVIHECIVASLRCLRIWNFGTVLELRLQTRIWLLPVALKVNPDLITLSCDMERVFVHFHSGSHSTVTARELSIDTSPQSNGWWWQYLLTISNLPHAVLHDLQAWTNHFWGYESPPLTPKPWVVRLDDGTGNGQDNVAGRQFNTIQTRNSQIGMLWQDDQFKTLVWLHRTCNKLSEWQTPCVSVPNCHT